MAKPGVDFPGVGVGLAVMRDGKLLLYRRKLPPEAGHWNIVGGKVDILEPSQDAARREAEEESGLLIGQITLLKTVEKIIPADRQHWVSLVYGCTDFSGEPVLREPEKLSEFGWFALDALPEPLSAFTRNIIPLLASSNLSDPG